MGTVQELAQIGFDPNKAKHLGINGIDLLLGGWIPCTYVNSSQPFDVKDFSQSAAYASATSFTVQADIRSFVELGDAVKWKQPTAGQKYGNVAAISYSAPNTTITVFANDAYAVVNEAITDLYFSRLPSPEGFPTRFSYTPTLGSAAGTPSNPVRLITDFKVTGGHIRLWLSCGLDLAAAVSAYLTYTIPVAGFNGGDAQWFGSAAVADAGTIGANGLWYITNSTTGRVYRSAAANWTVAAGHTFKGSFEYRWA